MRARRFQVASCAFALVAALAAPAPGSAAGDAENAVSLGDRAYRRGDLAEAVRRYRAAAEAGNAKAQARLGDILDKSEENGEAIVWFRKSAQQGDPDGLYGLGQMIAAGEGTERSPAEALRNWRAAAERGHIVAALALARIYESGWSGVAADRGMALRYWKQAAESGDASAAQRLAAAYRNGELGLVRDESLAASWEARRTKDAAR